MKANLITIASLLALASCGGGSGGAGEGGSAEADNGVSLFAMQPGKCLDTGGKTYIDKVLEVPCTDVPKARLAGFTTIEAAPGAAYPGWHAIDRAAYGRCEAVFESLTGQRFWDSPLDIVTVTPTASQWRKGDRSVACLIVP